MHGSNDIDLMVMASLMPTPDGILLMAALGDADKRPRRADDAEPDGDGTVLALLLSAATLVVGLVALLPATV